MDKVNATRNRHVTRNSSTPETVAEVIFQAATDSSDRFRYLAGADARRLAPLRQWLGDRAMMKFVRRMFRL